MRKSAAVGGYVWRLIDSGVYKNPDLRVANHVNFAGDGKNYDCYGHGTHVAGIVAAKDNARDVVGPPQAPPPRA